MDQGSETGSSARASATKRKILEMSASRLERTSDALITPYCRIRGSREFALPPPSRRGDRTRRRLFRGISICLVGPIGIGISRSNLPRLARLREGESRVVTRPSSTPLRRDDVRSALSRFSRLSLPYVDCVYGYAITMLILYLERATLSPERNSQRPLVKNVQRRKRW